MRRIACLLLVMTGLPLAAEEVEQIVLPEGYRMEQSFAEWSKEQAQDKAPQLAKEDLKKGITRILVFGLRRGESPSERYLAKTYGVYFVPIAGCCVTDGIIEGAKAYNEVVEAYLKDLYKKDIFEEASKVEQKLNE